MTTIWILDRNDTLEADSEVVSVVKELKARDAVVETIDWSEIRIGGNATEVLRAGRPVPLPSLALLRSRVFTRHVEGDTALLYDWLDAITCSGVRLVNSLNSIRRAQNKVVQARILKSASISTPPTLAVKELRDVEWCLRSWGETIIKRLFNFERAPSVSSLTFGGFAGCSATVLGVGSSPGS